MGVRLMALRAGRLRQRIDILAPTEVDDGKGGFTTTLQPIATSLPAEVVGLNGRETVLAQALQSVSVYQIVIRYRADVVGATALQLQYGTISLNMRSATDPDGRREQVVIIADTAGVLPA